MKKNLKFQLMYRKAGWWSIFLVQTIVFVIMMGVTFVCTKIFGEFSSLWAYTASEISFILTSFLFFAGAQGQATSHFEIAIAMGGTRKDYLCTELLIELGHAFASFLLMLLFEGIERLVWGALQPQEEVLPFFFGMNIWIMAGFLLTMVPCINMFLMAISMAFTKMAGFVIYMVIYTYAMFLKEYEFFGLTDKSHGFAVLTICNLVLLAIGVGYILRKGRVRYI